ncbi:MAG: NADH:ubiquinone oxidoreductase subunit NDUFA12 [Rhodomicrobium sp.]
MGLISDIFTWWNGATLSTRLYTNRHGKLAGEDEQGNRYYEDPRRLGPAGKPRRWVIYKGYAEASKVPPDWYGWLHYITDTPPDEEAYHARPWQKPHVENYTGTPLAYHPPGSLLGEMRRPKADGDYQPWNAE